MKDFPPTKTLLPSNAYSLHEPLTVVYTQKVCTYVKLTWIQIIRCGYIYRDTIYDTQVLGTRLLFVKNTEWCSVENGVGSPNRRKLRW